VWKIQVLSVQSSLNHLVRPIQHRLRNRETDLLGRFQIYDKLKLRWLFHRQIGGFCTLQDLVHGGGGAAELIVNVHAVGMTETLNIESIACQESALHGLGHWQAAYPAEVELIIDRFLSSHRELRPETVIYAKIARCGCVQ
jgi:hypothetical protein